MPGCGSYNSSSVVRGESEAGFFCHHACTAPTSHGQSRLLLLVVAAYGVSGPDTEKVWLGEVACFFGSSRW